MAVVSSARRAVGAAALTIAVWTLLAGLFAMHGLPMQQPMSASMSAPMTTGSTAMQPPSAMHAHDRTHTAGAVDAAAGDATDDAPAAAPTGGCDGADHCTATLRSPGTTGMPAAVTAVSPVAPVPAAAAHAVASTSPPGRPPDLDTLQISRT